MENVFELLSQGENQWVEFKEKVTRELAKEMVAFANTEGGKIFLGVTDDGKIVGLENIKEAEHYVINVARNNCDPPISPKIEKHKIQEKGILILDIHEDPFNPHMANGRFYIRVGSTKRIASQEEIFSLFEESIFKKKKREEVMLQDKVEKAIKDLRFRLLRNPTTKEVAYEIGVTPAVAERLVWKSAPKTKWREPKKDQISDSKWRLYRIYELAALMEKFGEDAVKNRPWSIAPGEKTPSRFELKRAKYALKHEKDKLPKIVIVKENEKKIEFDHKWPKGSLMGDSSEIYDKIQKKFSGAFTGERQIKIIFEQ